MEVVSLIIASMAVSPVLCAYYDSPSTHSYLPTSLWFPQDCRGTLKKTDVDALLKVCSPEQDYRSASSPAEIDNIEATLFLSANGKPAVRISFEAESTDSSQVYTVNVLANGMPMPIFCAHIITSAESGKKKVTHKFSVDMTCSGDKLTPGKSLTVKVNPTPFKSYNSRPFKLPGCDDKVMAKTKECEEINKAKIKFRLRQVGNGTMVVLDQQSAYQNKKDTVIHLQLRLKRDGFFLNGWKAVGEEVELRYPQRRHIFRNLTPGERYSVLVWRNYEYKRYFDEIQLKHEEERKRRRARRRKRTYN